MNDIEQLQELFEAPDIRPLSASDISTANRRQDEMLALRPCFLFEAAFRRLCLDVHLFTKDHGNEVAGVILVDPADENSILLNTRAKRWMKLRDQATGRPIPPAPRTGPPSTGYRLEDDYLGDQAQRLYLDRYEADSKIVRQSADAG